MRGIYRIVLTSTCLVLVVSARYTMGEVVVQIICDYMQRRRRTFSGYILSLCTHALPNGLQYAPYYGSLSMGANSSNSIPRSATMSFSFSCWSNNATTTSFASLFHLKEPSPCSPIISMNNFASSDPVRCTVSDLRFGVLLQSSFQFWSSK